MNLPGLKDGGWIFWAAMACFALSGVCFIIAALLHFGVI